MRGVVLLAELDGGEWLAVHFEDEAAARAWQDQHEDEWFTCRGVVPVGTRGEALNRAGAR